MRIILGLAAGMAAMAIGSAVEARPGGAAPGGGPPSWSNGGGHHAGKSGHAGFGISWGKIDRRPGRHRSRFGRSGREGFNPYGRLGIAGPIGSVAPYGNGFFNGGGEIRLRGRQPYYEYDRAYPYEWASATVSTGRRQLDEEPRATETSGRCTMENGVRVCRGW